MRLFSLSLSAAAVFMMSPVDAKPMSAIMHCFKTEHLRKELDGKYKESRVFVGLINERLVMEIFRSEAGTFTVVTTDGFGTSCIRLSGSHFAPFTLPDEVH